MASASGADEEPRPSLPVLIVPGIICSALRVEQSSVCPEWEGQRIFAPSVGKVASSSLKRKGTWDETEEGRLQNALLQHFVLKTPTEEPDGIRVRAIEGGLSGLNLFDAGVQPNIEATGFRQGNLYAGVIKALKAVGYTEGKGMECASYDWRMAPGVLESRDGFFKRMKEQIERMNEQSDDRRGVVLFGHSMGNKVVQYFLNYIMASDGQAWLDRHIYSWLLVGAPLLGAAYCGRMAVSGDCPYPGLDTVFSKKELVILYRSLGSLPWLFPIGAHGTHLFYVRRQGALEVQSLEANVAGHGFSAGNRLKLLVEVFWGRGRTRDSLVSKSSRTFDGEVAAFDDQDDFMRFGGPPELPRDATIAVTVAERGLDDGKTLCKCSGPCCLCLAPCALCRAASLACLRGARCSSQCWRATKSSARGEDYLGTPRAATASVKLAKKLRGGGGLVTLRLPLRRSLFNPCAQGEVVLQLRWLGAEQLWKEWGGPGMGALPSRLGSKAGPAGCFSGLFPCLWPSSPAAEVPVRHRRRPHLETYDKVPLPLMLRMLQCERALQCWEDFYKSDPLYNDAGEDDAPPVQRVVAVSGCNVRTEVGCVLRLNTHRASNKANARTRFMPDEEAELTPGGSLAGCSIAAGALFEEPGDEQQAGDGTVPFCSLHHSSTWADKLQYEEHLLPRSSHTVNMVDPRFHKLLLKFLTPAPS